ncbi:Hsp70 family protein [Nocardioides KLBMP 9356]|uniref:Hsp70 family protein n=1 Tax=Nocardioides potassii TaxID=2911371 RepID=A0ABS9H592_9ACTN|nr:Hsp70 family protein [Nocardioides potassii]MCF6376427.1 Hsp70 family protein [Nocardioides potassii]
MPWFKRSATTARETVAASLVTTPSQTPSAPEHLVERLDGGTDVALLTHAIGVDFGTSTTLVAEGRRGRLPLVFPVGTRGTSWLPSLIGVAGDGALVVGEAAADLPVERLRRSIKRAITKRQTEIDIDGIPVSVDGGIRQLLNELAFRARDDLDLDPGVVRLGCPAMWTGDQRKRLLEVARSAGLPVDDHTLIDEPIAAGVAWVNSRMARSGQGVRGQLLVFDMGGGTLDVAVLDVRADLGHEPEISVLSSWGVDEAGDALDEALAGELEQQLRDMGHDVDDLPMAAGVRAMIRQAAKEAKERLSHDLDTQVAIRHPDAELPTLSLSQEQVDTAIRDQLTRATHLVWAVLRGAQVTHEVAKAPDEIRAIPLETLAEEVDFVLLAGGMSRVPSVARMLASLFPHAEISSDAGVASDEAIVAGLAETASYERVNLHRPPFHFVLEYEDKDGVEHATSVYEAHSPFYPPYQAMQRSSLYYEWRPPRGALPAVGAGLVSVFTAGGERARLSIDGADGDGFVLRFGPNPPAVLIYPNGRVLIVDGKGSRTEFLVPRWPVIRGKDHAVLYANKRGDSRAPLVERSWMKDPLFLH